MKSYITQGWLVVALALGFGAALAGVDQALGPKILANQKAETYSQIPSLVLADDAKGLTARIEGQDLHMLDAQGATVATLQVAEEDLDGQKLFKVTDADSQGVIGYVAAGEGLGYGDKIQALIGFRNEDGAWRISGVYVLSQKETPGLGSKIASPWNRQYAGKPTNEPLVVVKTKPTADDQIQAISGATISSNALTSIVNATVTRFNAYLSADKGGK